MGSGAPHYYMPASHNETDRSLGLRSDRQAPETGGGGTPRVPPPLFTPDSHASRSQCFRIFTVQKLVSSPSGLGSYPETYLCTRSGFVYQ